MATWRISGTYLELCNCDPGCGCNFRGVPNSPEGNCEAFVAHRIEDGSCDGVDLSGAKVAWALWWPGAIHEGNGHGHAYVDASDGQFDALARMWRGEEGYSFFEIFNSTFTEPSAVDRATVEMTVDGKSSRFSVEGVGEAVMTPLRSPVSGEENNVRIVKDEGFIWADGDIAQSERLRVELPEMKYDVAERHAVFAAFEYANG
ncbi:MAG: DUF1326 domain-containing protein [Gaiellaceae bacterium]